MPLSQVLKLLRSGGQGDLMDALDAVMQRLSCDPADTAFVQLRTSVHEVTGALAHALGRVASPDAADAVADVACEVLLAPGLGDLMPLALTVRDGAPSAVTQQLLGAALGHDTEGCGALLGCVMEILGAAVLIPALLSLAAVDAQGVGVPAVEHVSALVANAEGRAHFGAFPVAGSQSAPAGTQVASRKDAATRLGTAVRQLSKAHAAFSANGTPMGPLRELLVALFDLSPRPFTAAVSRLAAPSCDAIQALLAPARPALTAAMAAHKRAASATDFVAQAGELASAALARPPAAASSVAAPPAPAAAHTTASPNVSPVQLPPSDGPSANGFMKRTGSAFGMNSAHSQQPQQHTPAAPSPVSAGGTPGWAPGGTPGAHPATAHLQQAPTASGRALNRSPLQTPGMADTGAPSTNKYDLRAIAASAGASTPPQLPQASYSRPPPTLAELATASPAVTTGSTAAAAASGGAGRQTHTSQTPPHSPLHRQPRQTPGSRLGVNVDTAAHAWPSAPEASTAIAHTPKPFALPRAEREQPESSGPTYAPQEVSSHCATACDQDASEARDASLMYLGKLCVASGQAASSAFAALSSDILEALLSPLGGGSQGSTTQALAALAALRRLSRARARYVVQSFSSVARVVAAVPGVFRSARDVAHAAQRTLSEVAVAACAADSSVSMSVLTDLLCAFERGGGGASKASDDKVHVARAVAILKALRSIVTDAHSGLSNASLLRTASSPVFLSGVRNAFLSSASELRKNLTLTLAEMCVALGAEAHPTDAGLGCCPSLDGHLQAYLSASQLKLVRIYIHKQQQ